MSDPYVLQDGHLPTPFSAAEIRDATPPGTTVETVTEEAGEVVARHRTTFVECDHDGATIEGVALDTDGVPVGEPTSGRSTWLELQGHASFPADRADRSTQQTELPIGTLECWQYEVRHDGDRGAEMTSTFWFAKSLPGQPVRYAMHLEHERDRITTVTSITHPA